MAALIVDEDSRCGGCGQTRTDLADPRMSFTVTDDVCPGCKGIADVKADLDKQYEKTPKRRHGLQVYISGKRRWSAEEIEAAAENQLQEWRERMKGGEQSGP